MAAASYYIVITSSNTYLKYFNSDANNVSFAKKIFNIVETVAITTTLNVHEKMEKTR